MRIAHELARQLERDANRFATQTVFGHVTDKTLGQLLEAYHAARAGEWSDHHAKAQTRFREFWLGEFGPDCALYMVTPAKVEELAKGLDVQDETRRKYLVYITGAYRYARRKLKWVGEEHDLSEVEMPKGGVGGDAYSLAEVRALLPALEAVSDEAGWFGHVLFQSGRRPTAVRSLRKADVTVHADHSVITFRGDTDKAGRTGHVVVVDRAHDLTRRLMLKQGGYVLGPAIPDETWCLRTWLRPAEEATEVPHVIGRGWYGFKRRYVGEARGVVGFDKQSGVRRTTLEEHYLPDDIGPKRAVAEQLARSLIAPKSVSVVNGGEA